MPSDRRIPEPAYFHEVDEQGKPIRGSKHSARRLEERTKISQRESSQGKLSSRKSHSDSGVVARYQDGISPLTTSPPAGGQLERRKTSAGSHKSPKKPSTRPSSAQGYGSSGKPSSSRKEDASHYGVPPSASRAPPVLTQQPQAMAIPRPSAFTSQTYPLRPGSYHAAQTSAGYGPPLSASAYYQPPPVIMPAPSYPPPSPSQYQYAVTPQASYFDARTAAPVASRPLASRFEPIQRTTSAYGTRDTRDVAPQPYTVAYDDEDYRLASETLQPKRASIRVPIRTKAERDYDDMPPPPRPILRRPAIQYYADSVPDPPQYSDSRKELPLARRPSMRRNSVSYDLPESNGVQVYETANKGRRRSSYYDQSNDSAQSSDYDAKIRQAQNYQEEVAGPEPLPLTADMLKRQQQQRRHAGSSRSTKSSGSKDESDYRNSATTRTTRSGSGADDENVTIKVTGSARVMVGGAQIECTEGGKIEINRQMNIRNGSERGSEYGGTRRDRERIEDRRSRVDRPPGRSRMSSSHQSYTRETPWM